MDVMAAGYPARPARTPASPTPVSRVAAGRPDGDASAEWIAGKRVPAPPIDREGHVMGIIVGLLVIWAVLVVLGMIHHHRAVKTA